MINKKITTLVLLLLVSPSIYAQGWNGINPLKSTRSDVEKTLGKCKNGQVWSCLYKTEEKNILILYYDSTPCANGVINVSKGTVLSLSIFPLNGLILDDLKVDLKSFIKEEDSEVIGVTQFINRKEGITIETKTNFVVGIYYEPSEKNIETYKCK